MEEIVTTQSPSPMDEIRKIKLDPNYLKLKNKVRTKQEAAKFQKYLRTIAKLETKLKPKVEEPPLRAVNPRRATTKVDYVKPPSWRNQPKTVAWRNQKHDPARHDQVQDPEYEREYAARIEALKLTGKFVKLDPVEEGRGSTKPVSEPVTEAPAQTNIPPPPPVVAAPPKSEPVQPAPVQPVQLEPELDPIEEDVLEEPVASPPKKTTVKKVAEKPTTKPTAKTATKPVTKTPAKPATKTTTKTATKPSTKAPVKTTKKINKPPIEDEFGEFDDGDGFVNEKPDTGNLDDISDAEDL